MGPDLHMKDKKKTEIALAYENVASQCANKQLFAGWTRQMVLKLIEATFKQPNVQMTDLLPRELSNSSFQRQLRHWSSGYCYIIAEVAKIMVHAAGFEYKSCYCPNPQKQACMTHWVLIRDEAEVFDPEEPNALISDYSGFRGKALQFRHPSKRALTLFERVLAFGVANLQTGFQNDRIDIAKQLLSRIPDFRKKLNEAERRHARKPK